ncbi:uncharacterized protein [Argopecten irradians]|uniref:uncharacterized protein n=1 Tax=Argopecten irradians TaxID=31199 RepID=UPI0037135545
MKGAVGRREKVHGFGVVSLVCTLVVFHGVKGTYPYYYHSSTVNWADAQTRCAQDNMMLVDISTQDKYNKLRAMDADFNGVISSGEVWIGLQTSRDDCTGYVWDSGEPSSWYKWDANGGDPNFCTNEKCVRLRHGLMRTTSCTSKKSYICEAVPDETTTFSTTNYPTTEDTTTAMLTETSIDAITASSHKTPSATRVTTEQETVHVTSTEVTIPTTRTTDPLTDSTTDTERTTTALIGIPTTEYQETTAKEPTTSPLGSVNETTTHGNMNNTAAGCFCAPNTIRGIIPSSVSHKNSLVLSGYKPVCSNKIYWGNGTLLISREEKLALLSALEVKLSVAKTSTSLYRRKLISVPDKRTSAVSVGSLGICLLVSIFGTVILMDITTLCRRLAKQ